VKNILKISSRFYTVVKNNWESRFAQNIVSNLLIMSFIGGALYYIALELNWVQPKDGFINHILFPIDLAFTLLLIFEVFNLIFTLPKSVARSNSQQYEILSLIFLRSAFKEFSHFDTIPDIDLYSEPVLNMLAFGIGGLLIFFLTGLTNSFQQHLTITKSRKDKLSFIAVKKMLSLGLLIGFLVIGVFDVWHLINTGTYDQSFASFYTLLVFSDILIVLIALRYSTAYHIIFRYSAFILATIIIRISFSFKGYEAVIVGVSGSIFVLLLTLTYNYFNKIGVLKIDESK